VGSPPSLRVATYNVHACVGRDGRYDPDRVATVIGELDADVVALQEFTYPASVALETRMPVVLTTLDRYECALGPTRQRTGRTVTECFGNALLTRHPIIEVHRIDLSMERREPRGALAATIDVDGVRLHVLATHLGLRVRERRFRCGKSWTTSIQFAMRRPWCSAISTTGFRVDQRPTCSIAAWDGRRVLPRFQ
jgi:endonuclease/exonuclease/phosphatase family metal-dependent hydrolase